MKTAAENQRVVRFAAETVSVVAGIDTYTTQSILPYSICERLRCTDLIEPPKFGYDSVKFLDGSETKIAGEIELIVKNRAVNIELKFLVVRTVIREMRADLLLGIDYIRCRKGLKLDFSVPDEIVTTFSAAVMHGVGTEIDEGDFTLNRMPSGQWSLKWKWLKEPPTCLFKGTFLYESKLRHENHRELFNAEVDKWIERDYLIEYDEKRFGKPKGFLTWNPVISPHKSTPVRPALDFTLLNEYVACREAISEAEICTDSIRVWRRFAHARLIDVEKAFMNIFIHESFYAHLTVQYKNKYYCLTRLGFGLHLGCRVLKALLKHIFASADSLKDVVHFRDDILVGTVSTDAKDVDELEKRVQLVREILKENGLPTKPPINLYDFSKGATMALGLKLTKEQNTVKWSRRPVDLSIPSQPSFKDIASLVGRVCPGHLPRLGALRPAALKILSLNGKLVVSNAWRAKVPEALGTMATELANMVQTNDQAKGTWKIPNTNEWVLATDASADGLGMCVISRDDWKRNPNSSVEVIQDHAWLNKTTDLHINVLELNALIKSFKIMVLYLKKGDSLLIVNDSKVVVGWLNRLLDDRKIHTTGLYALLVERRLSILKTLIADYRIEVQWIASENNPADCLTRCPKNWDILKVLEKEQPISCAMSVSFAEKIKHFQDSEACRSVIANLDQEGILTVRNEVAYIRDGASSLRIVLPEQLLEEAIQNLHCEIGHGGWKPTWISFKKRYFLKVKDLARKIQNHLSKCTVCIFKNAKTTEVDDRHSRRICPWDEIFVDVCQMSAATEAGPYMILAAVDNYSKFAEVFPLRDKTAETIAGHLEEVFTRYGSVQVCRCDNGKEFANATVKDLAEKYNVKMQFGSVRNPQSQATVERFHGTFMSILRAMSFGQDIHWVNLLYPALDAYRARPHSSLGGRSPREILFGIPTQEVEEDCFDFDEFHITGLDSIDAVENQRTSHDVVTQLFVPGEIVLVKQDPRSRIKLKYNFTRATVYRYLGNGAYLLTDEKGRVAKFNQRVLAKFRAEFPPHTESSRLAREENSQEEQRVPNPDLPRVPKIEEEFHSENENFSENEIFQTPPASEDDATEPINEITQVPSVPKRSRRKPRRLIEELD